MFRASLVAAIHAAMLWKGVIPMPPATNISGTVSNFGSTKSPIASAISAVSPGFKSFSACLKLLPLWPARRVVILTRSSVGADESVNQRRIPRLSELSWGRVNSVNCPAVKRNLRSGLNQNVDMVSVSASERSNTAFRLNLSVFGVFVGVVCHDAVQSVFKPLTGLVMLVWLTGKPRVGIGK
jgi:hypothetical protein